MKKILIVPIMFLMIFGLASCGSADNVQDETYYDNSDDAYGSTVGDSTIYDDTSTPTLLDAGDIPALAERKIIYEANVTLITSGLDDFNDALELVLSDYTVYIESQSLTSDTLRVTLRVLSSEYTELLAALQTEGEVVSSIQTSEDITNSYSSFEARYEALQTQHERVLAILDQATDLSDILTLTEELSDIEAELNEVGKQLETYDALVEFSTINLTVTEVDDINQILDSARVPNISYVDHSKSSIDVKVYNYSLNDGVINLVVKDNGEVVFEESLSVNAEGYVDFSITDLDSGTEYRIEATYDEEGYRTSNRDYMTVDTEHTFISQSGTVFTTSTALLGTIFEFAGYTVIALLPFAIVGGLIFIPIRYVVKKRKTNKEKDE
jgi:hypothetical protein